MTNIEIVIASDHAGFEMKDCIMKKFSQDENMSFTDLGTNNLESVDYPNYAKKLTDYMLNKPNIFGILICGSGIGMCMSANRSSHIRAVLATDSDTAFLSRMYNDANVLCLGARMIGLPHAIKLIETFINTKASTEERHTRRVREMGEI